MRFNIFDDLYHRNDSNPSLLHRFLDVMLVICGDVNITDFKDSTRRLGLLDYLTLGIITLVNTFFSKAAAWAQTDHKDALHFTGRIIIGIAAALFMAFQFSIAAALTLCLLPLIVLYHFTIGSFVDKLIILLLNQEARVEVDEAIANALLSNNYSIVIFEKTISRPGIGDYLTGTLNDNPSIKTLQVDVGIGNRLGQATLKKLTENLKHIIELSAPHYWSDREDLHAFANSKIKHIQVQSHFNQTNEKDLLWFIEHNSGLETFSFSPVNQPDRNTFNLKNEYQKLMEAKGIQKGCVFDCTCGSFEEINKLSNTINAAIPMLESAFEFFRLMKSSGALNLDVTRYLLMMLFSTQEIIERNKKGYARLVRSNFFFSSPTNKLDTKELLELDEEQNAHAQEDSFAII